MAIATQKMVGTILDVAIELANRYASAYRETLLTDAEIVAALTAEAGLMGFSAGDSREIAECGFHFLEQNHHALNP